MRQQINNEKNVIRGIIYCDSKHYELGECIITDDLFTVRVKSEWGLSYEYAKSYDIVKDFVRYSPFIGEYILTLGLTDYDKLYYFYNYSNGNYPYNIPREYEAENQLHKFGSTAKPDKIINYDISELLKYTFGLEFETNCGYISERDCFSKGLIPLRDGSIGGIEYSTVVLKGNKGLNLLREQVELLKENTFFDKECSLHVHMGGFPVDPIYIFTLYNVWYYLQGRITDFIPAYSFKTRFYKATGKDYCKMTPYVSSFDDLFSFFAESKFMGSLYQAHPCDIDKKAKWHIKGRYFNCNFINMLCYNCAKTVEFRFLRPTYNFNKICTWLLIFNAILEYSEKLVKVNEFVSSEDVYEYFNNNNDSISLEEILTVYPKDVATKIINTTCLLRNIIKVQNSCGDNYGLRVDIEDKIFADEQKNTECNTIRL